MRRFLLGGIAAAAFLAIDSGAGCAAQRARSQNLDSATRAQYARAWHECYLLYSGYRGPAGTDIALQNFESCFMQKTGRSPFQLGRQ